ncbi:AfsR/SARP family transcriptional regulator [Bailinhaonella thermotolerans]|uniref:AfsR/SARP family transcriptional regulator n=1 Tax=Bailinhaonella thermotolerans TaxID=1070861 RepID=UPI001F5BB062|nr:AfsR/SARP family transcriptional regulator [Bailinhaonella thermotolerans]
MRGGGGVVLCFQVLGPLVAAIDGEPVDLGRPRQRSVAGRLLAARGQVVPADRLIDDLYADEAPPRALAAVQAYVSNLRRALEPGRPPRSPATVLVTVPPGYALRLAPGAVDAWRFEEAVRRGALLRDAAGVHTALEEALRLWRGTPYQEFAGLQWADAEILRLEELRLTAVERRADAASRLGLGAEAVADLERVVGEHPLREEAWGLLATALYRCGRQGEALGALRRARAHLADELGIDPGSALRRLEQDILTQAPHLTAAEPAPHLTAAGPAARLTTAGPAGPASRPPAEPVPAPEAAGARTTEAAGGRVAQAAPGRTAEPAGSGGTELVGRDAELERLTAAAGRAAAGAAAVALVTGEPGAGKTALVEEVRARLAAEGWAVGWGRCPEHEGAPAGWPWAELLRPLAAAHPPSDPAPLAPLLTDDPPGGGDVAAARFRLHRAVAAYVAEVAAARPLLIVLDDLHRADAETLAVAGHLLPELPGRRVLLVGSYRHTEPNERLEELLAAVARLEPVRVELRGLAPPHVGELVRAVCGRHPGDGAVAAIAERTGGNPFFVRELARLRDAEGGAAVPAGVRDVLRRRVARLPGQAQTILRQAAVLGRDVDVDVLVDVAGADEETVLESAESGLVTGLLTEPGAGRLRFAHALVRDTLYHDLSRLRRARLHARAAAAIERHHPGDVAALAHHFAASGAEPAKAARYARLAAEQAERRFAHEEAVELWRRALDLFEGDPRERLELMLRMVAALANGGQLVRARSYRQEAVRAAAPLGDPELFARAVVSFEVPHFWVTREYGELDADLVGAVEEALDALPPGDGTARCRLLSVLAFELEGEETERGYLASQEAVAMARRLGDPALLALALNARYHQSYRYGGLAERGEIGRELLELAEGPDSQVSVRNLGHLLLMQTAIGQGDLAAADVHAEAARELSVRYDMRLALTAIGFYDGMRAGLGGDFAAAEERLREAAALAGRLGMWQHEVGLHALAVFGLRLTAGTLGEYAPVMEALYHGTPWREQLADLYALALVHAGREDRAREVAAEGPAPIRRDYFRHFLLAVRGLLGVVLDDRRRAGEAYDALLPFADEVVGGTGYLAVWPTAQVLGDLAAYLGRPSAAHYSKALEVAGRAGVGRWAEAARAGLARA